MTHLSSCKSCSRLSSYLAGIEKKYPHYHCAPVPSFGAKKYRLLIVGLAPGMHGANASGRPFTGDRSGELLFQVLHDLDLSNQPHSISVDDKLRLKSCRITNAVKCLPPENKPTTAEVKLCNRYLIDELGGLEKNGVVLSLGLVAHQAILRALDYRLSEFTFSHAGIHRLKNNITLVNSYHCSRYNIQTKRLNAEMFADVINLAKVEAGL